MKICFISRFDSFVNLAKNFAINFRSYGDEICFIILDKDKISRQLLGKIQKELNDSNINIINYDKGVFITSDVVFLCLTGGFIKKIFRENYALLSKSNRPLLISAYPGLVYQNIYDGFASRTICDIILFPSRKEMEMYEKFCANYGLKNVGIVSGYFPKTQYKTGKELNNSIVFAEQTAVPNTKLDRLYLATRLIDLAKKNPEVTIYLKPRISRGGSSLFKPKIHILDAIDAVCERVPENLVITYNPIEYYTSRGAVCLTISSTAAIETLQFHEKIAFISDFGPSENNGWTYFDESNLKYSFQNFSIYSLKKINSKWKDSVYISSNNCIDLIRTKINCALKENTRNGILNFQKIFSKEYFEYAPPKVKSLPLLPKSIVRLYKWSKKLICD